MALVNPSGLYNGSAPLNPLPYVNIAMQARQRKAAREDALNKYYEKLPDTINDKGVRDTEIPIINGIKTEMSDYYLKNRQAINNPNLDNGEKRHGLDLIFRKGHTVARLSQGSAKSDLEAGKFFMNKDNQYALNNEDYVKDVAASELPVTDPNHKDINLQKYATNRPFDQAALIKRNSDIKYSDGTPEITDHPTDPLSQVVTTRPVLDEANKGALFSRAANDLHNDPVFANKVKNHLVETGQLENYAKIAKDVFGIERKDLNDEALAASYEYSILPVKQTVQKRITDIGAVMDKNVANKIDAEKRANAEYDRRAEANLKRSLIKINANKQTADIVQGTSGNSFDEFGGVQTIYLPQSGGKIEKGIVYDKDGNLYNGEFIADKVNMPSNITTAFTASKIPIGKYTPVTVKDGVIQSIRTANGEVSRQAMENLQKKSNTEPVKAPQPVFGKPQGTQIPTPAKKITDPNLLKKLNGG